MPWAQGTEVTTADWQNRATPEGVRTIVVSEGWRIPVEMKRWKAEAELEARKTVAKPVWRWTKVGLRE